MTRMTDEEWEKAATLSVQDAIKSPNCIFRIGSNNIKMAQVENVTVFSIELTESNNSYEVQGCGDFFREYSNGMDSKGGNEHFEVTVKFDDDGNIVSMGPVSLK